MILILGFFSLLVLFSYHKSIRQCCRTKNCVANRFNLHNKREKLKLKKTIQNTNRINRNEVDDWKEKKLRKARARRRIWVRQCLQTSPSSTVLDSVSVAPRWVPLLCKLQLIFFALPRLFIFAREVALFLCTPTLGHPDFVDLGGGSCGSGQLPFFFSAVVMTGLRVYSDLVQRFEFHFFPRYATVELFRIPPTVKQTNNWAFLSPPYFSCHWFILFWFCFDSGLRIFSLQKW